MEFFYGNWRALLRKKARFDTAQNEFFPDKKGTGGEKSRIFLNGDSPGVHFLTNTIPYRFPNCNVSFFTKKIPADPQTARRRGGTGPGQGRETEKMENFSNFFRNKSPLCREGEAEAKKFFREKSPLISGAHWRKQVKKYIPHKFLYKIRTVYDACAAGRTPRKALRAPLERAKRGFAGGHSTMRNCSNDELRPALPKQAKKTTSCKIQTKEYRT